MQTFSLIYRHCSSANKMPSALLILAEGAEEMETVITADVLRRGGVEVNIAGLAGADVVKCSRNVVLKPDSSLDEAVAGDAKYDVVVCPGGAGGAQSLAKSSKVGDVLRKQSERGGYIACVCAAPIALESHGVALGKKLTSHPSVKDILKDKYTYSEERVVVDDKLITSRGPGTCFEFALAIVEALQGRETSDSLIPPMLVKL